MRMTNGIFVTGTDTAVGKTVVSAAVLSVLRAGGLDAVPMKPVQTGCTGAAACLVAPDLEFCLARSGVEPRPGERADMAPYRFRPACSPHLAAERAGVTIRVARIRAAFNRLARAHDWVVVEGAGGVLVPLGRRGAMADLISALGLPVLLVARPALGTLNHTMLSLAELRRRGLSVAAVVLCATGSGRPGLIERDNVRTIERMGAVRVLGPVPHWPGLDRCGAGRFRRAACAALPDASEWLALLRRTRGVGQ